MEGARCALKFTHFSWLSQQCLLIILGMVEKKQTNKTQRQSKLWIGLALSFILPILLLHNLRQAAAQPTELFGYGANVAEWDITKLDSMGFNWIKVFLSLIHI